MRKTIFVLLALSLLLGGRALAADLKIAVIGVDEVMSKSEAGAKVSAELRSKFESREKELAKQDEELKKIQEDLKNKSVALKQEAQREKQNEFEAKLSRFRDAYAKLAQDEQNEQKRVWEPMLTTLRQVVTDFGKKSGYSIILERGSVLYATDAIDLTNEVTKEFDRVYKKGGK